MNNPVARDEKSFQVINRCSLAGRVLFEPQRGKKFPVRFAPIRYEYNETILYEEVTDNEGRFFLSFVPHLDGKIAISMNIVIDSREIGRLKKIGGGEYVFYFPEGVKRVGDITENYANLEILLDNEDSQPDFILRELVISLFREKKEELANIFVDEIKEDISRLFNKFYSL